MGARIEDQLIERLHSLALDETLQVVAGATIGAHTLDAASALDATIAAESAIEDGEHSASAPRSLPRISLARQRAESSPPLDQQRQPDLLFEEVLGEGGMGRVHLAHQHSLRRHVAVKTLKEGATQQAYDALVSEARVTGFLGHPGIIPVHSLGLDDHDQPVLVMKRIDGVPWRDLLIDPQNPAWADWDARISDRLSVHLEILSKVCDALDFAHSAGIVHRDIKPENVMLGRFGEVYLVDWGLARQITGEPEGQLVGTPAYMPPEMALGEAIDARTDVYLLGATLHEVLTGGYLHQGETLRDLLLGAVTSLPFAYPASIPAELAELCHRATSQKPDARPPSAASFRQAISDFLGHRTSIALGNAAILRLKKSEEAMRTTSEGPSERAFVVGTHCAEARFGFEQALEAWPQNRSAQEGLQRCHELLVESHLLRRDPVGALAELQAVKSPPPGLAERIEALQEELKREQDDQERLKRLDRDADVSLGFRERLRAYLVAILASSTATIPLFLTGRFKSIDNADTVLVICSFVVLASVMLLIRRKALLSNAFSRRVAFLVFAGLVSVLINRIVGWQLHVPVRQVFVTDLLLMTTCAAIGGAFIRAWIYAMTVVLTVGIITIALAPASMAGLLFSAFAVAALLLGGAAWLVANKRVPRAKARPSG